MQNDPGRIKKEGQMLDKLRHSDQVNMSKVLLAAAKLNEAKVSDEQKAKFIVWDGGSFNGPSFLGPT